MDRERLAHFRQLLEEKRAETVESLEHLEEAEEVGGLQNSLSELSMYDNHPADVATETFERSKDIGLRDLNRSRLREIDEAIERLRKGSYGICRRCGREIPEERLEAVPEADHCVDCQRGEQERLHFFRRPVEEGVVMPPFGGFAENRLHPNQEVEFDGEDSWQAVARYGTSSGLVRGEMNLPEEELGEQVGLVEDVEGIPYYRDHGRLYRDYRPLKGQ